MRVVYCQNMKKDNKLVKFDGFYYLNDQKHTVKVTTDKQRNIPFFNSC